ncbi:uncharacterized protein G2W53_003970 [Senna tora]|uniref:Uncharacterized protein n=1 Tax=Senna tora TaxID=362788 RepID=A0A834XC09_9FABA|nr:uncharacterized protein G2W53_003970 [Senna tora]
MKGMSKCGLCAGENFETPGMALKLLKRRRIIRFLEASSSLFVKNVKTSSLPFLEDSCCGWFGFIALSLCEGAS